MRDPFCAAVRSKAYWGYSPAFLAACREELTFAGSQMDAPEGSFTVAGASLRASVLTVQSDPGAAGFYLTMGARAAGWRDSHSIAGRRLPMFAFDLASS